MYMYIVLYKCVQVQVYLKNNGIIGDVETELWRMNFKHNLLVTIIRNLYKYMYGRGREGGTCGNVNIVCGVDKMHLKIYSGCSY